MSSPKDKDEIEILFRLTNGNIDAFDEIYWKYQRAVYMNAFKLTRDMLIAEDIVQETFISLWEKRHTIDTKRSVAGWLFVSSYNRSVNALKKKLNESLAVHNLTPENSYQEQIHDISDLQLTILEEAIALLPHQKRKVVELCKLQGKSYEEAAKEMNISKHTVKEYLSDSIKFIRSYANEHPLLGIGLSATLIYDFVNFL